MSTEFILRHYYRINDLGIVCPICGKDSWCLIAKDGSHAVCPRVESLEEVGQCGYRHELIDYQFPKERVEQMQQQPKIELDWNRLQSRYTALLNVSELRVLAYEHLHVSTPSLVQLGCGWDGEAWTFPIKIFEDICAEKIVGIQRRYPNGDKRTMKGSRLGLFIPSSFRYGEMVWVFEGMSDTAAGLDFGLNAVGKLSCSCGHKLLAELCAGVPVVIVSDTGNQFEIKGAQKTQRELDKHCPKTVLYLPPAKDFREWVKQVGPTIVNQKIFELENEIGGKRCS